MTVQESFAEFFSKSFSKAADAGSVTFPVT